MYHRSKFNEVIKNTKDDQEMTTNEFSGRRNADAGEFMSRLFDHITPTLHLFGVHLPRLCVYTDGTPAQADEHRSWYSPMVALRMMKKPNDAKKRVGRLVMATGGAVGLCGDNVFFAEAVGLHVSFPHAGEEAYAYTLARCKAVSTLLEAPVQVCDLVPSGSPVCMETICFMIYACALNSIDNYRDEPGNVCLIRFVSHACTCMLMPPIP